MLVCFSFIVKNSIPKVEKNIRLIANPEIRLKLEHEKKFGCHHYLKQNYGWYFFMLCMA